MLTSCSSRGWRSIVRADLEQAVPLLQESAALLPNRAGPRLVLAMAQFRSGSPAEARQTLAAAVRAYNWMESQADHPRRGSATCSAARPRP